MDIVTKPLHLSIVLLMIALMALPACRQQPQKVPEGDSSAKRGETGLATPEKGMKQSGASEVVSTTTVLASIPDLAFSNPDAQSLPGIVIGERGYGAAYIAGKEGAYRVVVNGKTGKNFSHISHLKISPDGNHVAHDMLKNGKRCIVLDGREGKLYDDVWEPVFSPDSRHVAYIAQLDKKSYMVVDGKISSEGYLSFEDNPVFSADSSKVAYVVSALENQKARLIISDLSQRTLALHEVRDGLVVNRQKTRVAVAQVRGNKQLAIEIDFANPDKVKEGPLYDSIDKLAFSSDGDSVTYIGKRANKGYLILDGKEEHLSLAEMWEPPVVRPDKKGAGLILISEGGLYFHQTYGGVPKTLKKYQEAAQLVYSGDSSHYAYCARNGKQHFVVADGKEGPIYDMVINPDFSPDGRFLVYRARKDGKRFVVVADTNGKVTREHPVYEQIFRPVFNPDGKSVAYGVKDGNQLIWKVEQLDK